MSASSLAGFRRLWPLLKPHRRRLLAGAFCALVAVASFPLLALLAGRLLPAIGAGDFSTVLRSVGLALGLFFIQKLNRVCQKLCVYTIYEIF